tara:strand:- start:76 stop:702 length:627 start_codon:yes stop_codon:yes gene_type:complete
MSTHNWTGSANLTDIKNLLAGTTTRALRDNRFSIDMELYNPISGWVSIVNYPAISVSSPTTEIESRAFEFQNIALNVPIKRKNTQQLQISFYANESLAIYSTLVSLIKTYGGESHSFNSNINQPTAYNEYNMYNTAIRNNWMSVRLKTNRYSGDDIGGDVDVNYIAYSEIYPVAVIPMDFNSQSTNQLATFTALFNFARTTTKYLGEI